MLNVLICSKLFNAVHEVLNKISQGLSNHTFYQFIYETETRYRAIILEVVRRKIFLFNKRSDYSSFESIRDASLHQRAINSLVRDGSKILMHSLIRNVGQGSNRQDFVGEDLIILPTSSSETCLKTAIFGGSDGG